MNKLPTTGGRHKRDPKSGRLSVQDKPTRPADPPTMAGAVEAAEIAADKTDTKGDKA